MAHADSSSQAWENLNHAIWALDSFVQIISTTNAPSYQWLEHASLVFCHLAKGVSQARDTLEDEKTEKISAAQNQQEAANG